MSQQRPHKAFRFVPFTGVIAICALAVSPAAAKPFPGLERLESEGITVAYHPDKATLVPAAASNGDAKPLLLMKSPVDATQWVVTRHDTGSDYVMLSITKKEAGKALGEGTRIGEIDVGRGGIAFLPGGRAAYAKVEGVSYKYLLGKTGTFREVKQPFAYLGHKTTVQVPKGDDICGPYTGPKKLVLRTQKKADSPALATLKAGAEIEVVLRDGDWFLIKTPFGLNGWAKPTGFYSLFGFANSCVG